MVMYIWVVILYLTPLWICLYNCILDWNQPELPVEDENDNEEELENPDVNLDQNQDQP